MLMHVFQREGTSLGAGKVSLSTLRTGVDATDPRDDRLPVKAASHRRSSAFAAPPTPPALRCRSRHRGTRAH